MKNNEIINVQMTKEVFDTLGSGGNGGNSKPIEKTNISISDNYNESLNYYVSEELSEETISLLKNGKEIHFQNAKVFDRNQDTIFEGNLKIKSIHKEIISYEGVSVLVYLSLVGQIELPSEPIPDTTYVISNIYPVWAMIEGDNKYMVMSIGER